MLRLGSWVQRIPAAWRGRAVGGPAQRRWRGRVAVLPLVVLLSTAALVPSGPSALASPDQEDGERCPPEQTDEYGRCHIDVEVPDPVPGIPGDPNGPSPGSPGSPGEPSDPAPDDGAYCEWITFEDQSPWRAMYPDAPSEAVFGRWVCYRDGRMYSVEVTWIVPRPSMTETTETVVLPGTVAQMLRARVEAILDVPNVGTWPPHPRPSLIGIPTFFEVTNWQGELTESGSTDPGNPGGPCITDVYFCVTLTATPSLTLDPGESGARSVACEGAGTRFDGSSEPDAVAARPGACTHTYSSRTVRPSSSTGRRRVESGSGPCQNTNQRRPDEPYVATACITWTIRWEATNGMAGDLPSITMRGTTERPVAEITTVVVDDG